MYVCVPVVCMCSCSRNLRLSVGRPAEDVTPRIAPLPFHSPVLSRWGGEERGFFQRSSFFFGRSSFFWKVVFQVFSRPPKGRLLEGSQNGGFRGFQIQRSSLVGPSRTGVERVQGTAFTGCSVQSVLCVQRAALPVCAVRSVYSGQRVRRVLCPR